jgi:hypothetical protein
MAVWDCGFLATRQMKAIKTGTQTQIKFGRFGLAGWWSDASL